MSTFEDFLAQTQPRLAAERVLETSELVRIRELPWVPWQDQPDLVDSLTAFCRMPAGVQKLRPMQAATLAALSLHSGVLNTARTGGGKTLLSLLAAHVTDLNNPVLLVPASLRDKTRREMHEYARNWKIHPLRILSYEGLGRPDARDTLTRIGPNLLVCDEVHMLRNQSAAVTNRVREAIKQSKPKMLFLSGSVTNRSLRDFNHLLRWLMGDAAPLPRKREELQLWSAALDVKVQQRPEPGALMSLAPPLEVEPDDALDRARSRFARRLHACPQIIGTGDDIPDIPLLAHIVAVQPSDAMAELTAYFDMHDATPCGQPFAGDPLARWRHHRTASAGLYNRWKVQPPADWLAARKLWAAFVRNTRTRMPRFDSPAIVAMAVDRGDLQDAGILRAWREIEPSFTPVTEPVWICDSTLRIAADWLEREQGICWVKHVEFGRRLSEETKIPYFRDQGRDPNGRSIAEHRGPAIASLDSCSRGFNLHEMGQHKNFYVTTPTTNKELEQSISRTHRDGQDLPVYAWFLQRLEGDVRALEQATADADFTARITRQPQRVQIATWDA